MNAHLARRIGLLAVSALLLVGTLSQAAPAAPEPDLQDGDLFVGAISENDGWGESGVIKRVRGGSVSTYCESPFDGPDKWKTPHDVLVDSQGRVVFLAEIGLLSYTHGIYGLLRCSGAGSTAEKLAVFGVGGALVEPVVGGEWRGYPVPYPNLTIVGNVGGLHLARKTAVVIDDDIAGGKPKTGKQDVYGLVISIPSEFKSVQFRPDTGEWEKGAQIVLAERYVWSGSMPDATYYGGATYSALQNQLGRDREPFRFEMKGKIEGVDFGLRVGVFGGYTEVGGQSDGSTTDILDDVLIPNADGGCPPGPVSTAVPKNAGGNYNVAAGFGEVAKHRLFGVVVTSNSIAAGAGPFLTQFGEVLLNDNPFDDPTASFQRPEVGCTVQRRLEFESILPFWDPDPPAGAPQDNGVTRLVSGSEGLFGTQPFNGRVVRIRPGDRLGTIASGLIRPTGIAAYPANVPPGLNVAIVIRIDSPVNVLVTDASGKRIGVDASGNVVNDFGPLGYVGDPGEPRLIAIREPTSGDFSVDTLGTGTGPYAVHAYSINTDEPLGEHIVARGTAAPGSTSDHDFTLAADGTVTFHAAPPPADATPPLIVPSVSPDANAAGWHRQDVSVSWSVTDPESGISSSSGCGLSQLVDETAGSTLTCTATNGAGLTSSQSVTVKLDRTPPTIAGSRAPDANAHGWNNTDVTVSFTCTDALSGVSACSSASTLTSEGADQSVGGGATDAAGNTASTRVSGISIDKTAPEISGSRTPAPNANGWNNTDVTVLFACSDALSGVDSCGPTPQVVSAEGRLQARTGTAIDLAGNSVEATVGFISIDKTGPTITCNASPSELWPPNHRLVGVTAAVKVTDALAGAAGFVLTSAVSDEPDEGLGDGDTVNDIQGFTIGLADTLGRLRAERNGRSDGRVYTLTYSGADAAGNLAGCAARIVVPKSRP